MWTSLYYGHWDYWELRHRVTFDGRNRLILINDGETSIDMQTEVYSDWKEWVVLEDNLKYYPPLNTVGGEPTVGIERLDVTYFLINNWKFKPYPGTYDLQIVGNVFDVDGGSIKVAADINKGRANNISINTNTSVIVRLLTNEVSGSGGSGTFDPDTIVSASLFGIQETALYNIENRVISIQNLLQSPITASLVSAQSQSLNNIEILNTSQSSQLVSLTETNVTQSQQLTTLVMTNISQSSQLVSLVDTNFSQSQQLNNLESQLIDVLTILNTVSTGSLVSDDRVREIWELHGLDDTKPLNVTRTGRTFGSVTQTILTTGTGSLQETTITRI
jgi:hypothetical protein